MNPSAYHPHTVLAGGISHLGAAMPAATSKTKPTKPVKTMPNPAKPGRPAKPATLKTLPKDEDYSTTYVASVAPPVVKDSLTAQPSSMPELDDIVIEDNVPLPCHKNTKVELMQALLKRLQPGQSSKLALHRGPNGETWSGRGLMPRWLAA